MIFVLKNNWFTYAPRPTGKRFPCLRWESSVSVNALAALDIMQEPYDMAKVGNSAMGYAYKRIVAVNPMCPAATTMPASQSCGLGNILSGEA